MAAGAAPRTFVASRASKAASALLRDVCVGPPHGSDASRSSIAWLHHASPAERNAETQSPGNVGEAGVVGSLAACFIAAAEAAASRPGRGGASDHALDGDDDEGESATRVVVVTPYLHHKSLIERAIASALVKLSGDSIGKALHRVTSAGIVNTADSFQGQVRLRALGYGGAPLVDEVLLASAGGGYRPRVHGSLSCHALVKGRRTERIGVL